MTLAQALAQAMRQGLERLDAQLLLLQALEDPDNGRAWLLAHDGDALDAAAHARFVQLCLRRVAGEPLAYIAGHKEFHGLRLQVDARVLVPRPDTETIVDWALELLAQAPSGTAPRILDLGTGSGAIALAIKHRCPAAQVEAVDTSADALAVAQANAQALALDVVFRQASWLAGSTGPYDLIVTNPPYIAQDDAHLQALGHEPRAALVAGADGLDDLRAIAAAAPACLAPGGWLLLEHGWDQAAEVAGLLRQAGLGQVAHRTDLAGIARCTGGRRLELG